MNILLVHFSGYTIISFGLRSISSCLKREGHQVTNLFIPFQKGGYDTFQFDDRTVRRVSRQVSEFVSRCSFDLVGLSLTTNFFAPAAAVSAAIKKERPQLPILWGGVHPTAFPEKCLHHADMVCLGEGEGAAVELAEKMQSGQGHLRTPNLWFANGGSIVRNDVRNLEENLDALPFQDFGLDQHHLFMGGRIVPITEALLYEYMPSWRGGTSIGYATMITRGCPYRCTYCFNHKLHALYRGKGRMIRSRTVPNVIAELVQVVDRYRRFDTMHFTDDAFLLNPKIEWYEEFCAEYKRRINLPFSCISDAAHIRDKQLELLVDAGLYSVQIGIQSGSTETLRLYKRHANKEFLLGKLGIVSRFSGKLMPSYDVILDNPYETEEDTAETLRFLARIPKPFRLNLFSLTFYPGTPLYDKAISDGLVAENDEAIYGKNDLTIDGRTYVNQLMVLVPFLSEAQLCFLLDRRKKAVFKALLAAVSVLLAVRLALVRLRRHRMTGVLVAAAHKVPSVMSKLAGTVRSR